MPPLMQSVARPFFALRFCISWSSVTTTRHASLPRPPKIPDQHNYPAADDIAICKPPKIPLLRPCERSIKSAYEIRVEQEAGGSGGKERAEEILPISDCAARTAQRPASWLLALAVSFR